MEPQTLQLIIGQMIVLVLSICVHEFGHAYIADRLGDRLPREQGRVHIVFGASFEMDAHIDVLVTPRRMRLILLPTRGMPGNDAVIIEDFLFEKNGQASVVRLLSSGVPSAQAWVTYYLHKRRFWELALKPWDTAAGSLIVYEAGGRVTDFSARTFDVRRPEVVASNGLVHDEMLAVLRLAESIPGGENR